MSSKSPEYGASPSAIMNVISRRLSRRWSSVLTIAFIMTIGWLYLDFLTGFRGSPYQTSTSTSKSIPTVNLVLATTQDSDLTWTKNVSIPNSNMQIIPYVADDQNATYHPPENKGNEAMIILTYFYEFYDNLPDISIFTHSSNDAWHNEDIFDKKISPALNQLDLSEVMARKYVNLKISGYNGCPAWINTSITMESENYSKLKEEEPFMKEVFEANFPGDPVPEIWGSPCCSQFAVTKDAILAVPRAQFLAHIQWLQSQNYPNGISGRLWEHLWQYIFLGTAVECPVEYKALCRQYHICFETAEEWERWNGMEKERLEEQGKYEEHMKEHPDDDRTSEEAKKADREREVHRFVIANMKAGAVTRGKSVVLREKVAKDLEVDGKNGTEKVAP